MPSNYETFWAHGRFAVVGHGAKMPFPKLTYRGLKRLGKKVLAIDPSAHDVEGDPTYPDLAQVPEPVDSVSTVPPGFGARRIDGTQTRPRPSSPPPFAQ